MPRIRPRDRGEALAERIFRPHRVKIPNAEFARIAKCSPGTVSNYKNGRTPIPLEVAIDAANATGMTDEEWIQLRRLK